MTVVTLGPAGTYSYRAARSISDDIVFRDSVTGIVESITEGDRERAVIPIENSIEGSVSESLDALSERDVSVLQEVVVPIDHAVLGQEDGFSTIASHSQALAQCREYLQREHPDVTTKVVSSTARGVEIAREDATVATIAHPSNADRAASLRRLATDVQDRATNETRFFVLGPATDRSEFGAKSSVIIYPAIDYPGVLVDLLESFAERDINLTRVDARPSKKRLGDYVIHSDLSVSYHEDRAKAALEEIAERFDDGWVRWLGSYDTEHLAD